MKRGKYKIGDIVGNFTIIELEKTGRNINYIFSFHIITSFFNIDSI